MKGPFGDWLVNQFTVFGITLQNWMIPFLGGVALGCLVLWHIHRR
jgi:hypothetical protein